MARPLSELEAALAKHRAELAAGERRAANRMVRAYGQAWTDARRELDKLLARLEEARAAGLPVSPAWAYQQPRLQHVLDRLEAGLRTFGPDAAAEVLDAQRLAVRAAQAHAGELIEGQLPDGIVAGFEAMPEEALADLIGFAGDGSPLEHLFGGLPGQAGGALERAITSGLAQGLGPRQIAAKARAAVGQSLNRALTITRTEMLRSYRESTGRLLEANPDVAAGWTWWCACDRRSCAVCWTMHGRQFPADQRLDGHPNCRCAMVPLTASWAHLGLDAEETRIESETGDELLARADRDTQRAVLGPGKLDAFERGELDLGDLVARDSSPQWGTMRRERSLSEVRELRASGRLGADAAERLGPGRVDLPAGNAPAATRAVSEDQARQARATVAELRRAARAEADAAADDAWALLGGGEDPYPPRPPQSVLQRTVLGRSRRSRGAGSWDWLEQVDDAELKRYRRWFDPNKRGELDGWAAAWGDSQGLDVANLSTDDIVDVWRGRVDRYDALKAVRGGKLPSGRAYPGLDPRGLLPDLEAEGFDLRALFTNDLDAAAGHVLDVWADQAADIAGRVLGSAADYTHGPAPWLMSEYSFEAELMDIEGALAEYVGGARPPAELVDRWHELIPDPALSRDLDGGLLSAEAVWARIQDLARAGGLL